MNHRRAQNILSTTAASTLTSSDRPLYSNNVTSFDKETIRRLQQNVDETRKMNIQVERAKDLEEAKQVDLENHLRKISATISELHDAINKSRRREEELSKQIESWVELIKNHKQMVEREDARFQSVSEESEQLCDDLEFNICLLKRKRISVDALMHDLAQTREDHGVFIKQLRNDLKRQTNELETWDKRSLDNKQPLVRLGGRYKIASHELEVSKARFAENQAAIAVLTSRLNSTHCDDVVASVFQAPAMIVQGTPTPVNLQPMKAQTMTLAPVLVQSNNRGRHTSESLGKMPMEFESRAPAYVARLDVVENHPHNEKLLACEKKTYANEESSTQKGEKENICSSGAIAHAPINEKDKANGQSSTPKSEKVQGYQELPVSNEEEAQANRSFVLDKDQVNDLADKLFVFRK